MLIRFVCLSFLLYCSTCRADDSYSFIVAGDMRNFTGPAKNGKRYFDGVCAAVKDAGAGAFMLSPGDCDPPGAVRAVISEYLGTNYPWYLVAGNHDVETKGNLDYFRRWSAAGIPGIVQHGPKGAEITTYSFDYQNSHFVVLDDYFNGISDVASKGDLSDATLRWLEQDLAATTKPLIWVTSHKPIQSQPDMDTGRVRHNDPMSADPARIDRFILLLKQYHVRAYLCGHTHDTSVVKVKDIWQADSGHSRGAGDTGAPSSFLKIRVEGVKTWVDIYRGDAKGVHYRLEKTVELD